MKQRVGALLPSAVAISAAAHAVLLLLVPYHPLQLRQSPAQVVIPVNLIHVPPAERVLRWPVPAPAEKRNEAPSIQESPAETPAVPAQEGPRAEEPLIVEQAQSSGAPGAEASAAGQTSVDTHVPAEPAQPSVEVAAYGAILSSFRGRIVQEIRYPAIARSSGWEGTVVLAVRLDPAGNLIQSIVRQSSGYEVLDRAAAALIRKVTPIANPLALPVTIEIPIVYELK
jgi:protein TonB